MKHLRWTLFPTALWLCLLASCRQTDGQEQAEMMGYRIFVRHVADSLSAHPAGVVDEALARMTRTTDSTVYYHYVALVAKAYSYALRADSAGVYLDRLKAYCDRAAGQPSTADLLSDYYNVWGNIHVRQGRLPESTAEFHRAFDCRCNGSHRRALPEIALNLADIYVRQGDYVQGTRWYRTALAYCDSLSVPEEERFPAYYGMGQVYMELRDYPLCDYYYGRAAAHYDRMRVFEQLVYLNNRGNSYYYREDYPTALGYFQRSLALAAQYPSMTFDRHLAEINLGETYLLMGKADSAAWFLNRCRPFFEEMGHATALYYIDTQLIELAVKEKEYALAARLLREASSSEGVEPNMVSIRNRVLQHYYAETGQFKEAYHYQAMNRRMDDSIRNERVRMRIADMDARYQQDSTLLAQRLAIRQANDSLEDLHDTIYLWVLACLLLAVVFLYYYNNNKRKQAITQLQHRQQIRALRIENLRHCISPHFIFNVLNHEFRHYTDEEAKNMRALIKLMRTNLELAQEAGIPLAQELDFVTTYVELMQRSLQHPVCFHLQVDSRVCPSAVLVPSACIQIPVENALKHALAVKEGEKHLWVDVGIDKGQDVRISIYDNGGGCQCHSRQDSMGIGMRVIFQTIQLLNDVNRHPIRIEVADKECPTGEMGYHLTLVIPEGFVF